MVTAEAHFLKRAEVSVGNFTSIFKIIKFIKFNSLGPSALIWVVKASNSAVKVSRLRNNAVLLVNNTFKESPKDAGSNPASPESIPYFHY